MTDQVRPASLLSTKPTDDRLFRWLTVAGVVAAYAVIVLGGIVRVTGSGLGCPDWPLCYGRLIPPLHGPTLIEYTHRLATTALTPLVLAVAFLAWRRYRWLGSILAPALAAVALLTVQIVLGGITVLLELPETIVTLHMGNAMLLLAALLFVATQLYPPDTATAAAAGERSYRRLTLISVIAAFGLIIIGALVRGAGAGPACKGFPDCNGQYVPQSSLAQLHMIHRLAATIVGVLVGLILIQTWRNHGGARQLTNAAVATALVFLGQFGVGIAQVTVGLRPILRALHVALATAFWGGLVVLAVLALRPGVRVAERLKSGTEEPSEGSLRGTAPT